MSSFNGLKTIAATDIQNSGRFYLGSQVDPGTAGQALVSAGPNEPARWDTHTGTIQPLTMGTNVSLASGNPDFDGSIPDTLNSVDTTYTAGNGIQISGSNQIQTKTDNQTIRDSGGGSGNNLEVIKVPNDLTFTGYATGTYNGSSSLNINLVDTDTTYVGGKNININPFTTPETINLDDDLTDIDSITFTSTAGTTALTGNNYPSNPTPMTYFDLSSSTNIFPDLGGVGVGGLGGIYKDTTVTPNLLYRFLLPSDFLNDNDSSGYARSVIADSSNHGAQQCYAGSQYYAFFTIPDGYYFSGFRVNLVNSVGTPQGTTPTSSFYVNVYTKTIDSNLTTVGTTKGYNTDNLGYTINSGYGAGWTISDPITIGAIHCFRNPWSSAYYNRGGWIQYTEISSGGGGSGSA